MMKKAQIKLLKWSNTIIAFLIVTAGFAVSCEKEDEEDEGAVPCYGVPSAIFTENAEIESDEAVNLNTIDYFENETKE